VEFTSGRILNQLAIGKSKKVKGENKNKMRRNNKNIIFPSVF
jgi:hypothetical protein